MSQDRLRDVLQVAAEAARASPEWRDGDQLCIIAADGDATVLHSWGFGAGELAACLEFMAAKQRAAQAANRRATGPPG